MPKGVYKKTKEHIEKLAKHLARVRKPFPRKDYSWRLQFYEKKFCQICKRTKNQTRLEIHHIKPVKYDKNWNRVQGKYEDHDKSNLIVLCNSCHQKTHHRKSKIKRCQSCQQFLSNTRSHICRNKS